MSSPTKNLCCVLIALSAAKGSLSSMLGNRTKAISAPSLSMDRPTAPPDLFATLPSGWNSRNSGATQATFRQNQFALEYLEEQRNIYVCPDRALHSAIRTKLAPHPRIGVMKCWREQWRQMAKLHALQQNGRPSLTGFMPSSHNRPSSWGGGT